MDEDSRSWLKGFTCLGVRSWPLTLPWFLQRANGTARRGAAHTDGVALAAASRQKEKDIPRTGGVLGLDHDWWCSQVRLGDGGPWSGETSTFSRLLAEAKARPGPQILRRRAERAWRARWAALLSCAAARAFACSLLNMRGGPVADGDTPSSHEVLRWRHPSLGEPD